MIIGDGIVLGSGGETASIVVTAPTGSTVTCTTPIGIVLTATEVSGTWTFANLKVYGTYIITATDGTTTKTQEVLVDSADMFSIEIDYILWLYKDGTSYDFENFHLFGVPSSYGRNFSVAGKITTEKIDLSKYRKICWESSQSSFENNFYYPQSIDINNMNDYCITMGSGTSGEASLEDINDTRYVAVGAHQGSSSDCVSVSDSDHCYTVYNSVQRKTSYFDRVWLE